MGLWQPLCLVLLLPPCPLSARDGEQSPQPLVVPKSPSWAVPLPGTVTMATNPAWFFPAVGISPQGWNSSHSSGSLCADSLGGPTPLSCSPCPPRLEEPLGSSYLQRQRRCRR